MVNRFDKFPMKYRVFLSVLRLARQRCAPPPPLRRRDGDGCGMCVMTTGAGSVAAPKGAVFRRPGDAAGPGGGMTAACRAEASAPATARAGEASPKWAHTEEAPPSSAHGPPSSPRLSGRKEAEWPLRMAAPRLRRRSGEGTMKDSRRTEAAPPRPAQRADCSAARHSRRVGDTGEAGDVGGDGGRSARRAAAREGETGVEGEPGPPPPKCGDAGLCGAAASGGARAAGGHTWPEGGEAGAFGRESDADEPGRLEAGGGGEGASAGEEAEGARGAWRVREGEATATAPPDGVSTAARGDVGGDAAAAASDSRRLRRPCGSCCAAQAGGGDDASSASAARLGDTGDAGSRPPLSGERPRACSARGDGTAAAAAASAATFARPSRRAVNSGPGGADASALRLSRRERRPPGVAWPGGG